MKPGHRYEIVELETKDFGTWDFCGVLAAMVVESENGATVVITDPADALRGVLNLDQWRRDFGTNMGGPLPKRVHLDAIVYDIWAPDAKAGVMRSQRYRHEFTGPCWIDGACQLRHPGPGPMFAGYALNFLVDTKNFPRQTAIQFVN